MSISSSCLDKQLAVVGLTLGTNESLHRRAVALFKFGKIPEEHWKQPDWINEEIAKESKIG